MKNKHSWYEDGISRQGDAMFILLDELPDDAVKIESNDPETIIAHSETGHNHVIKSNDIDFYKASNDDKFGFYIVTKSDTYVTHLRAKDTHDKIYFKKDSIIKLRRHKVYEDGGYKPAID